MFEEINAFSKLIIFESKSEIEPALQNMIFGVIFSKCVNMPHVNAL